MTFAAAAVAARAQEPDSCWQLSYSCVIFFLCCLYKCVGASRYPKTGIGHSVTRTGRINYSVATWTCRGNFKPVMELEFALTKHKY